MAEKLSTAVFTRILTQCLCLGVCTFFLFYGASSIAATQLVIKTQTIKSGKKSTRTERIVLDGKFGRIDVLEKDGSRRSDLPYMLTIDGGKTWLITDNKKVVCSNWDTKEFFATAGKLLNKYSRIINAKPVSSRVKVLEVGPGPTMLGKKTRFVKIASHLRMRAAFLAMTADYKMELLDSVWFSPDWVVDPIEQAWNRASTKTGYPHVDALSAAWEKNISGGIIKQIRKTVVTNLKKNEVTTDKVETVTVQSIGPPDRTNLPAGFYDKPKCSEVGTQQLRKEVVAMLREMVQ